MRVVLLEEVFGDDDISPLELLGIIAHGYDGRHRVLVEPLLLGGLDRAKHPNLSDWLTRLPDELHDEVLTSLRQATDEALNENRAKDEVEVAAIPETNWEVSPPKLTVSDARRLLGHSLHLLVENARNDRMFLEAMIRRLLGSDFWKPIEEALQEKWARFEHGGGLGSIKDAVENLADKPVERIRTWVMFDSDAPEPDRPSDNSERVRIACEQADIDHHQLRRRAMENYLPQQALHAAANTRSDNVVTVRRESAEAFSSLNEEQRQHLHMKNGLSEEEVHNPPELYMDVDLQDRKDLEGGFGSDIGELFDYPSLGPWSAWFENEYSATAKDEFEQIYDRIYRKL